jgi:anti-sigma B factor antagonist
MKVNVYEKENSVIVKLSGEMMLGYEANDFHEAIKSAIERNKKHIVIDLSEVKFITSWGIGILIYGYTTATNLGGSFKLASVPPMVRESLSKVKVDSLFSIYNTVDDALSS